MTRQPLVSILVLNYNGIKFCEDCFSSIRELNYPNYEVIMIDNSSTDTSVSYVRMTFPEVKIIALKENYGFAKANNIGSNSARGDYLFFLNQDIVIEKDCLCELVRTIESYPDIGICGGKMMFWNEKQVINSTGLSMNRICFTWDRGSFELDQGQYDEDTEVISVSGGAMLIKKDLFNDIGGFDSKYFMYYEDLDLGLRTWLNGYRVVFVPKAVIYHKMEYSHKNYYHFEYIDHRNRLRTILKNISSQNLTWVVSRSLLYDLRCIISWLYLKKFALIKYRTMALLWNLKTLPTTLQERQKIQRKRIISDDRLCKMMAPGYKCPVLPVAVPGYVIQSRHTLTMEDVRPDLKMGNGDEGQLGFGWYERENWDGKHIRWTTNYAVVFIKRGLRKEKKGSETVEIEMLSPMKTMGELYLNDMLAGKFTFDEPGWKLFYFEIMDEEEIQKVMIKTPGFIPKETHDKRLLGVAVSSLNVKISEGFS